MKQEILEKAMDRQLEAWRIEDQARRNRALQERMSTPRSTAEMLTLLGSLEGLRGEARPASQGRNAQICGKVAFIV